MLIRSIGSICTATFNAIYLRLFRNLPVIARNPNRWLTDCMQFASLDFGGTMFKLPSLSIAAKLYTIFALLATATIALTIMAILNSRQNAALTDDFEKAFLGAQNVERVNGLIYAVVMESRGVYMSPDLTSGKRYGDLILKFNERIAQVVADWRKHVGGADAAQFAEFEKRIQQFMEFRKELARLGSEVSPAKG